MTLEELKALIDRIVEQKLQLLRGTASKHEREDLWKSMLDHLIRRQPDEPSILESIRRDRER